MCWAGRTPPNILICQKFEQNLKKLGKEASTFLNNTNAIIFFVIEGIHKGLLCNRKHIKYI